MSRLVLNVAELLRRPRTEKEYELESTIEELGIVDDRLPAGPVGISLRLDVLTDGIVVNGTLRSAWQGECRRCLAPLGGPFEVQVQELYQTVVIDPEAFPIEHDQLDLTALVREALLLEAPTTPLCRPDCAGICPVCGGDRNETPCTCDTTPKDDRWAALDALREESR